MQGSLCRDGRLPSLVNRKTPSADNFPGVRMNRKDRRTVAHIGKFRGRWDPQLGFITWSKRNTRKCRREMFRRFMETGRL